MGIIKKQQATVWYSPSRGKRYLTKRAAISAEATALIYKRHPIEPPEHGGFPGCYSGYDIKYDEPYRYSILHRRVKRLISKSIKGE